MSDPLRVLVHALQAGDHGLARLLLDKLFPDPQAGARSALRRLEGLL
jgi:hypothetical protein